MTVCHSVSRLITRAVRRVVGDCDGGGEPAVGEIIVYNDNNVIVYNTGEAIIYFG